MVKVHCNEGVAIRIGPEPCVGIREDDGTRNFQAFAAPWLAYALPYRRFAVILADANARLGANADCYSFIAVDLHHLLFAGFYRRTESLD